MWRNIVLNSGKIYPKLTKIAGSNNAQIKIPLSSSEYALWLGSKYEFCWTGNITPLHPDVHRKHDNRDAMSRLVTFSISRWGTLILSVLSGNEMGIKANVKGQICSSRRRKKCPLVKEDLSKKWRGVWRPETLSTNTRWDLTILTISYISWQLQKNIHNQLNSN